MVERVEKKRKLPFGHYMSSQIENLECKPLNQEDYSEGWRTVLPKPDKSNPIHHWSVTLAQLPPHLWIKYRKSYEDNKPFYPIIKDNIYYYSINESKYDNELKLLYLELMKGTTASRNTIKEILLTLEGQVTGWLIIRAKKFLKETNERYFCDLDFRA